MSKIAEHKALEVYPMDEYEFDKAKKSNIERRRFAYIQGYDQAMQDFLEKAEKILTERMYFSDEEAKQFKNYMQDEM